MATWSDIEARVPTLASLGRMLLIRPGRGYLGTTRADGSPRVHVICPVLDDGHLYAGLIAKTPKCRDLLRDGRYVLHAPLGQGDAEFWIKGTAQPLSVDDTEKLMSKHEAWRMDIPSSMFELDIESAYGTLFQPGANGIPVPDRRKFSMA